MRPLLLVFLFVLAGLASASAHAQGGIRRCVDAAGRPVFTDRRCADLDATPALPATAPTTTAANDGNVFPDVAPTLCTADLGALRQQVTDAFASHQANRLAGLMLWDDYGERGAVERIRELAALVARPRPLLDLRDGDPGAYAVGTTPFPNRAIHDASRPLAEILAPAASGSAARNDDPEPQSLTAITAASDGASEATRFPIERRAGCLWLRPPA
ncbi:DUF4124 domain-containing protein [Dyella sp. KRB-257]|uniref:DUF4124 domain-containing protein n=1 Tax=Dyella sp. KRB-257 TaxID=3400915 RepID=UPI003C06E067